MGAGSERSDQLQPHGATQDGATQLGSQQVSTGAQQLGSTQASAQQSLPPHRPPRFLPNMPFILPNRPPRFLPKQPPLSQPVPQHATGAAQAGSQQAETGAAQAGSQQAEAAGAQQDGAQQLGSATPQPHASAQAAGAQQSGAAVQQAASGAQQVGSGAQQLGAGAQQVGAQLSPPHRPAEAKLALTQRAKAAVRVVHFMELTPAIQRGSGNIGEPSPPAQQSGSCSPRDRVGPHPVSSGPPRRLRPKAAAPASLPPDGPVGPVRATLGRTGTGRMRLLATSFPLCRPRITGKACRTRPADGLAAVDRG